MNKNDMKDITGVQVLLVEDIQESREAGMNEHISKPLDINKVITAIGRYVSSI